MADMFEEGIKAAGKAEYIGALPESTYMGGATIRDKMRGALRNLGMDNRGINALIGDMRDEDLIDNIGILDLTPAMLPAVVQEGSRSIKQGDYLQGGLDLGFSALEMAPFAAVVAKPLKSFLRNLGKKSMAKEAPVDLSRRKALGAITVAPIAATALSNIPVGKVIDDVVPAVKNVVPSKIEPTVLDQEIFNQNDGLINISKELDFAKDLYRVATGKSISKEKLVEKELAQYLYWSENGNFYLERAVIKKGDEELPMYELLELGDSPEYQKIAKKHMGDADGYNYGQSGGSEEFTSRLFQAENPDSIAHDEEVYVDWIKSKGIQNTQYYKDLVKAGDAD